MLVTAKNVAPFLLELDAKTLAELVSSTFDLALLVGPSGRIDDISCNGNPTGAKSARSWQGKDLTKLLPYEIAAKLLKLADHAAPAEHRFVSSLSAANGETRKFMFTAVRANPDGGILIFGQDVTQRLALQARIVELHQNMDAKIDHYKQSEAQYRTLFSIAAEPVLILDTESRCITDANDAALNTLGLSASSVIGKALSALVAKPFRQDLKSLLQGVLQSGSAQTMQVQLVDGAEIALKAFLSWGTSKAILLQIGQSFEMPGLAGENRSLQELLRAANEAVVIVDEGCQIEWTNKSFVELAMSGMPMPHQAPNLTSFFDVSDIELETVIRLLRKSERVRLIPTALRTKSGEFVDVELSAVAIPNVSPPKYGFVIRDTSIRLSRPKLAATEPSLDANSILNRLGTASFRDLMRDEMEEIERKVLASVLELTGNNRVATAKVLGFSRQTLYKKLHQFDLANR